METISIAIETATSACSTALLKDGDVLSEQTRIAQRRHNEVLPGMVDAVISEAGCESDQIDFIAVSIGPGSFTGLRVGLSFAKGFALAVGASVIPVGTLEGLAFNIYNHLKERIGEVVDQLTCCPLTVARRGEVFGQIFRLKDGNPEADTEIFMGDAARIAESLSPGTIVAGEGAEMILAGMRQQLGDKLVDLRDSGELPRIDGRSYYLPGLSASASSIGRLAWRQWQTGRASIPPAENLEPLYLKEFTVYKKMP